MKINRIYKKLMGPIVSVDRRTKLVHCLNVLLSITEGVVLVGKNMFAQEIKCNVCLF